MGPTPQSPLAGPTPQPRRAIRRRLRCARRITARAALLLALLALLPGLLAPAAAAPAPSGPTDGTPVVQADGAAWTWPLGGEHVVVRPFEAPEHRYGAGHRGVDLAGSGSVLAVADGSVRFRGSVAGRPVVSILHANGIISTYEPVSSDLAQGDAVHAGEVIGTLVMPSDEALSHCAPDVCLHLGARRGEDYLDPLLLLGARGPSVLLPLAGNGVAATAAVPFNARRLQARG